MRTEGESPRTPALPVGRRAHPERSGLFVAARLNLDPCGPAFVSGVASKGAARLPRPVGTKLSLGDDPVTTGSCLLSAPSRVGNEGNRNAESAVSWKYPVIPSEKGTPP
jgi:hypothetical protein